MDTRISSELLARIVAEASGCACEVCGLLIGQEASIEEVLSCRNVAVDPLHRFEIDPAALLAAHRRSREGGPRVLGHYHSHPSGQPVPSACDAAEAAADGTLWLIVGGRECRAWRAVADGALHGRFNPVALVVTPPCAADSAPPEGRG